MQLCNSEQPHNNIVNVRYYYIIIRRPSHLQIPDGPKMALAALSKPAIDGPRVSKLK